MFVLFASAFDAGLWMLPGAFCVIAGSMLAPVIVRRVRPAYVLGAGLILAALGFGVQTQVADVGLVIVVTGSALVSLALGPVFTLGADLVVGAAPPARAGAADAISETSAELGAALGVAVLGSVATALYRTDLADAPLGGVPPSARAQAAETLGGAVAAPRTSRPRSPPSSCRSRAPRSPTRSRSPSRSAR